LASNILYQIFMLPARAIALDRVSSAVLGMGLGGVVTTPDGPLWMERADHSGARAKAFARRLVLEFNHPPVFGRRDVLAIVTP